MKKTIILSLILALLLAPLSIEAKFKKKVKEPEVPQMMNYPSAEIDKNLLHMRDQVEAHKDKPIKYLYITDDTPEQCKSFLEPNNIKGEHIYISRSEWGYLQEKFQFTGIPFVVLFDKQGKLRKDATVEQLLNE